MRRTEKDVRRTFPPSLSRSRGRLTQEELAEKVGMSRKIISHYECGYRLPGVVALVRLARVLGVKVGKLLGVE